MKAQKLFLSFYPSSSSPAVSDAMNLVHEIHHLPKRPFSDAEDDIVSLLQKRLRLSPDAEPAREPPHLSRKRPRCDAGADADEEDGGIEYLLRKHLRLSGDADFPALTEEPAGEADRSAVCRVGVRMPDGRRVCRRFLKTEPVGMLWSFCYSLVGEGERHREFKLVETIPGAVKSVGCEKEMRFEDFDLNNSIVSLIWL